MCAWAGFWHERASALRQGWTEVVRDWEAQTEVGYPLPPSADARRKLGLALAELFDAIGGGA